jgi:hypothetical protein
MDVTLHRIEEALIRHRLEEAAMLTDMAAKVLNAITTLAGPKNGLASAVEQRQSDAMTLAQTIRRNARDYLKPSVEIAERVDPEHAAKVVAAKEAEA